MKYNSVLFGMLGVIRISMHRICYHRTTVSEKSLVLAHFVLVYTSGRVDSLDSADRKLASCDFHKFEIVVCKRFQIWEYLKLII